MEMEIPFSVKVSLAEDKANITLANPLIGDANSDGLIDALDSTKVERFIAGLD